ncbi:MAG: DoxX family membrane protein [Candidatus Nanohaloarchaea archaeon]
MERRVLETEIFGSSVSFEYAEHWVGYSLLAMRLGMGWIFLQAGMQKLLDPTWTAAGYLRNVPSGNPFIPFWEMLAGNPAVDALVIAGLTLIGLGLILGIFVRWDAFWGSVMMLFFWASSLEGGLMQGLPVAHGWVVDSHIVYVTLLVALGEFGSGRILGLDRRLEEHSFVEQRPWLKHFLG